VEVQLGNTENFKCVLLRKTTEWKEIKDSLNEELITRIETEEIHVFDQWTLIKYKIVRKLDKWNKENIPASDGCRFFLKLAKNA
jgi:DNA primase large subunit